MTTRQPRVPETRETKPNREQRRHPERPREDAPARDVPEEHEHGHQDVSSTRAKSSGHKKKTAENWNQ